MGDKMFSENRKIINIWYAVSFTAIAVGVIIGTLYYVHDFIASAEIKNYLDNYSNSLGNGMDLNIIIKSTMKSYVFLFISVAISGIFKSGIFLNFFMLMRKGFINAFTTAAMIDVYGLGGVALSLSSIVQIVVLVPVLCVFSAMSAFMSKNHVFSEKRDKIIYIIFLIVIFTIFCGCALFEGILTTTFMKWLAYKVT